MKFSGANSKSSLSYADNDEKNLEYCNKLNVIGINHNL